MTFSSSSGAIAEKPVAAHSSTLAWKIPWTEEPGGLQSMGSPRVGHDWSDAAAAAAAARAIDNILSYISFELFCRNWNPHRWKELTVCYPQALRPQISWNQKVDDVDSWLPHLQPIRWMSRSWSHTPHTDAPPHPIFKALYLNVLGKFRTSKH